MGSVEQIFQKNGKLFHYVLRKARCDMNREILFRGKRIDDEEWIYGMPARQPDGCLCEIEHLNYDRLTNGVPSIEYFEVDPKTVCQYTGFVDKYGNKIFEGDIVRYQFDNDDCPFPNKRTEKIIGKIFFSDFRASFSVTVGRNCSTSLNNDLFKYVQNGNRVEVIGNIFDNPELLELDEDD